MSKKRLTLDDLFVFCKTNQLMSFKSSESDNGVLVVHVPAMAQLLQFEQSENCNSQDMLYGKVKVCHTLRNRNNSYISEESMREALPTLKYRPLLGAIHQRDDGEWDFHAHDVVYDEDEVEYIETQIGTFTADMPLMVYDEKNDKTYVEAIVAIPEMYTKAADIIRAKGGTDVSCELAIEDMSFNAKEGYLELHKFYFLGCTCLGSEADGTKVEPGMEGAHLSIADFNVDNNSVCYSAQTSVNSTMEGVSGEMNHLEELMKKYEVDSVDFDTEGLSNEELDAIFAEHFESKKQDDGSTVEEVPTQNPEGEPVAQSDSDEDAEASGDDDGSFELKFQLSHDDIRNGLYGLLDANSVVGWIISVYDDSFIYEEYASGSCYKVNYEKDGDNLSLVGEAVQVTAEWLTHDEKIALDGIRSTYSELKAFKESVEAAEVKAQKDAIFARNEYAVLQNSEVFNALVADAEKYSVAEVESKVKGMFADYVISTGKFALDSKHEEKPIQAIYSVLNHTPEKTSAYGTLFDE